MRKIVLTFGLISGVILSAMMALTIPFHDRIGYDAAMVVGYTTMVLAFMLVYFGVRSYRDNVAGGTVRFGRAFTVGLLIAVIGSLCYVATWEVIYYNFAPDYMVKLQARMLEKARADGESPEAIAAKKAEMDEFVVMYKNPAINAAFTFLEPLPVAIIMSLVSAGVLSRRRREGVGQPFPVSDIPGSAR
jgi:xanthine/uracil/vitamin C permease (AzgA family)